MKFFIALLMGALASLAMLGVHIFLEVNSVDRWVFMLVGFVAGFVGSIIRRDE